MCCGKRENKTLEAARLVLHHLKAFETRGENSHPSEREPLRLM
jgi:hypothetical protein